jgi:hypothetical protein
VIKVKARDGKWRGEEQKQKSHKVLKDAESIYLGSIPEASQGARNRKTSL